MAEDKNFREKVLMVRRVAKVVEGGKRLHFNALVAVGDGDSMVGIGYSTANELIDAVRKAINKAKKNMFKVKFQGKNRTIPHEVEISYKSCKLVMKPAAPGTGVIAETNLRSILELAGYHDVVTKIIGSTNPVLVSKIAVMALNSLETYEEVAARRGISVRDIFESVKGA
ncbi:MAG: 30S ribosomal protein S5 [Spirochaetia bacterium]|nr:30S ribosomal protein S5 [Spirochaetota bacterium]MCX8096131.1 30S ribosomal protein S5 [Spirochaetota bacterium]MDW8112386.1 30S ribosomal protein S5 [Spirochaetia bacterium]